MSKYDELRELLGRATAGPWVARRDASYASKEWRSITSGHRRVVESAGFDRHSGGETETHYGVYISSPDADLIVALHNAAPDLLTKADLAEQLAVALDAMTWPHQHADLLAKCRTAGLLPPIGVRR